jgi:hypothetical protein
MDRNKVNILLRTLEEYVETPDEVVNELKPYFAKGKRRIEGLIMRPIRAMTLSVSKPLRWDETMKIPGIAQAKMEKLFGKEHAVSKKGKSEWYFEKGKEMEGLKFDKMYFYNETTRPVVSGNFLADLITALGLVADSMVQSGTRDQGPITQTIISTFQRALDDELGQPTLDEIIESDQTAVIQSLHALIQEMRFLPTIHEGMLEYWISRYSDVPGAGGIPRQMHSEGSKNLSLSLDLKDKIFYDRDSGLADKRVDRTGTLTLRLVLMRMRLNEFLSNFKKDLDLTEDIVLRDVITMIRRLVALRDLIDEWPTLYKLDNEAPFVHARVQYSGTWTVFLFEPEWLRVLYAVQSGQKLDIATKKKGKKIDESVVHIQDTDPQSNWPWDRLVLPNHLRRWRTISFLPACVTKSRSLSTLGQARDRAKGKGVLDKLMKAMNLADGEEEGDLKAPSNVEDVLPPFMTSASPRETSFVFADMHFMDDYKFRALYMSLDSQNIRQAKPIILDDSNVLYCPVNQNHTNGVIESRLIYTASSLIPSEVDTVTIKVKGKVVIPTKETVYPEDVPENFKVTTRDLHYETNDETIESTMDWS